MSKPFAAARIAAIGLVVAVAGCSEQKLGGDVEINGKKASVTACRVSQPGDEKWAEVSTDAGARIRVVQRSVATSGSGAKTETIVQLARNSDASLVDAQCQTKVTTSSTINGRTSGSVSLGNCRAPGTVVSGKFTYGQCAQSGA